MNDYVDVDALWHVGVFASAFAIGIVALYSLSIVAGARGGSTGPRRVAGLALAGLCLFACVAAVALGIWTMLDK